MELLLSQVDLLITGVCLLLFDMTTWGHADHVKRNGLERKRYFRSKPFRLGGTDWNGTDGFLKGAERNGTDGTGETLVIITVSYNCIY